MNREVSKQEYDDGIAKYNQLLDVELASKRQQFEI